MGDITACAARHQDFDARPTILFQQKHSAAGFGRVRSRHQPGGARSNNDYVPCIGCHAELDRNNRSKFMLFQMLA
jgi:hypothetical protein